MAKALVPVSDIPRLTTEVSTEDPIAVFKKFSNLQSVCLRENGVGLCAVQVGLGDRMFVIKKPDGEFRCFINASYDAVGDEKFTSCEGCLSLPGRAFLVSRFKKVRVKATEMLIGEGVVFKEADFEESDPLYTAVFQHEIDHCYGVMIDEIGREVRVRSA